jgi:superfamily I DNA/RNA helicase
MSTEVLGAADAQRAAIEHPLGAFVALVGAAGTGKSFALLQRAKRAREVLAPQERAVVSAAGESSVRVLEAALGAAGDSRFVCAPLGDVAFEVLQRYRGEALDSSKLALIDDVRAEELFSHAGASLFALEWEEFLSAELDPEITGMRAPERFAGTAYRLIRKLRMAGLSPQEFVEAALRGATAFYGRPPNLANSDLALKTPAKYRNSLRVNAAELARQHAREVDLSKIVGRLYGAYVEQLAEHGCLTRVDALNEAAVLLEARAGVREACARRFRFAFIDDAQDLAQCDARFLRALFGEALGGVTLAGDPNQRTLAFAGPRADAFLEAAPHRFEFAQVHRSAPAIMQVARAVLAPGQIGPAAPSPAVTIYRAQTMREEAAYVANAVALAIRAGVPANAIAVVARSLRCADAYLAALLDRDVPVDPAGEGSLYAFGAVEDALAALWSVADPYRNDWLLRNLEGPWLSLSDASIALLCAEPAEPQALLFELPPDVDEESGRRWDRRRDFRLAWNVLRGDRDTELTTAARERLEAFRAARRSWLAAERRVSVGALARRIFADTGLAGGASGARARLCGGLVARLAAEIDRFTEARPRATLHDFLLHAERVAQADDDLLRVPPYDADAVALLGVEAAKGREFAHVYVVDVRAGAFPRYYVPDAFGFSKRWGMIPKENVGEAAVAARTAKFTYLQYRLDVRALYHVEERRALYCAVTRARDRLSISASGRATRGTGAPEFLEELRSWSEM